ncbi:MAG TPA: monofunctional biosynthetic peptidoglycan transglycosylase [Candidatus Limnocylindrales bacterium]|nr:monofunctional biosynthetic peptidoglycan transglycosylase [Candidatus Limnocylindrales bacterium]
MRRRRVLRWMIFVVVLGLGGWLGYELLTWPHVAELATRPPRTTAFIERYRAAERAAGRPGAVARVSVPYEAISLHVKRAVLVAEDINFFSHRGFELGAVQDAAERMLRGDTRPRGASTITQQLAKNLWLSPSRSPLRKVREAILAWQLERTLSKRRILELYLNVAELGRGVYGVEAAARRYFGKSAAELDPVEAAQLAASLPRPRQWHPGVQSRAYQGYAESIRRRMERADFLRRHI